MTIIIAILLYLPSYSQTEENVGSSVKFGYEPGENSYINNLNSTILSHIRLW